MCMLASAAFSASKDFNWRGANVYFVITDRFCNGDTSNDNNYGRINDYGSVRLNAATFHGGDFKGMLKKAQEGYFTRLGIDVVWMTDVYEQIHGWMSGSGEVNDFPHYGYHGYYPLDYTQIDKNYGTVEELRALVDCLHSQGIRVMLGANLNDPGYPTLLDAVQYGFAPTDGLTAEETARHNSKWSYNKWAGNMAQWKSWWTRDWLRMTDENWDENDPLTTTLYGLPDFKTEKTEAVRIPKFLKAKWKKEGKSNDAWVNPSARPLRTDRNWAPSDYIIAWIASWVEEFGIDGFRCDIVEYVHLNRWKQLSEACDKALTKWRLNHPNDPAAAWHDRFYMTGDFDNASIDYKPEYADAGFMSMVNFYFPKHGDLDNIVYTWQAYADSLAAHSDWSPFSYLNNSYHRDTDMDNMTDCATTLLLSPGTIQLFYGDETRREINEARLNVDGDQSFRSDMNWNTADTALLHHVQRLGIIRQQHPAIALGTQTTIDQHTCVRTFGGETILIRLRPTNYSSIKVSPYFKDGDRLVELYSGKTVTVNDGCVKLTSPNASVAVFATAE